MPIHSPPPLFSIWDSLTHHLRCCCADNFMMNRRFPSRFTPRNLPQNPDWRIEVDKNHHDEYPRKWTNECPLKRKHLERKFHLRTINFRGRAVSFLGGATQNELGWGRDQANTEVKARTLLYTWYISGMYVLKKNIYIYIWVFPK